MHLQFVPTLEKLRDLYSLPIGRERFAAYIAMTIDGATRTKDVSVPPLVAANPMAKQHALEAVENWLALGANEHAVALIEKLNAELKNSGPQQELKIGLSLLDDLKGGWTHRYLTDAAMRFPESQPADPAPWITVPLWATEPRSLVRLEQNILEAVYRAVHMAEFGLAKTLRQMLSQEGFVQSKSGATQNFLADELQYTQDVIAPHLDTNHKPIWFACMYGDEAATACGYPTFGLSQNAGFELALWEAAQNK